jgi:N-acetylmuramoyl-L-alanine amidase
MEVYVFGRFVEYCSKNNYKIMERMKNLIIVLIAVLSWSNSKAQAQKRSQRQKVIVIDAGHGGTDSGAVSKVGLQEKDIVLDIAKSMIAWNKSLLASEFDIYLTRNTDTLISLADRVKLAKHLKPDVFISLHCNHIDNDSIKGVEVYVYTDTQSMRLRANTILNQLNQNLGFKVRAPKQGNFQVLRETEGYCASILLELGYLSNLDESEYLGDKENRKALALAILMSI